MSVSSFNAIFELLQFPLLFEKDVGGYFYPKGGERAMVYQNPC